MIKFTDNYINMCKSAYELQQFAIDVGDIVINYDTSAFLLIDNELTKNYINNELRDSYALLPCQNKLQSFVFNIYGNSSVDLFEMKSFNQYLNDYYEDFETLEEFWLSYLMLKKYNKSWDISINNWLLKNGLN